MISREFGSEEMLIVEKKKGAAMGQKRTSALSSPSRATRHVAKTNNF